MRTRLSAGALVDLVTTDAGASTAAHGIPCGILAYCLFAMPGGSFFTILTELRLFILILILNISMIITVLPVVRCYYIIFINLLLLLVLSLLLLLLQLNGCYLPSAPFYLFLLQLLGKEGGGRCGEGRWWEGEP